MSAYEELKKNFIEKVEKELKETKRETKAKLPLKGAKKGVKTLAFVSPENPNSTKISDEENEKRCEEFKSHLKDLIIPYQRVTGFFAGNIEHSFMLFNVSFEVVKYYARLYQQTSFIFANIEDWIDVCFEYYERNKENDYNKTNEEHKTLRVNDNAQDFTLIGKDYKFTIPFKQISTFEENVSKCCCKIPEYEKLLEDCLDDCVDDSKTRKFQRDQRRKLFGWDLFF